MWLEGSLSAAALGGAAYAMSRRAQRKRHYRQLAQTRGRLIRGHNPTIAASLPSAEQRDAFARHLILRVPDFLEPMSFERIRREALGVADRVVRSYVPTHKKGGTVSYETLHQRCPACLAFYHGAPVQQWVATLLRQSVGPAADHDQSANSLLFYTEAGDHIHWHYDHNFYKGRQFTVLLNLVNRGADGGLSASSLVYKSVDGEEVPVDTRENSFVIFEGGRVLHRATPTVAGDLRVMLSMTFNTDARISLIGETLRRFKDTAFFGVRVLWA